MSRISMAFRAFFALLFGGQLPADIAKAYGYGKQEAKRAASPEPPTLKPADGALQVLGILQRDARLIDFLMEDIGPYSDDQVGAAVRNVHTQSQEVLKKYLRLAPVIDGVEGTFAKSESAGALARDAAAVKFIGNVPAQGKPAGGTLRHKGWKVEEVKLPTLGGKQNVSVLAPAELEVE
ncbi:MAG: DUF2760 domain-containing protein [Bryobacterales bacterium]|nr:DUF2760 domain-containing protein [Bryobacterales bacterium]